MRPSAFDTILDVTTRMSPSRSVDACGLSDHRHEVRARGDLGDALEGPDLKHLG